MKINAKTRNRKENSFLFLASLRLCAIAFSSLFTGSPSWGGNYFSPPVKITDGSAKFQLSRTAKGHMALDSSGTLHATYWSGGTVTSPTTPSYIFYRSWTLSGGWSAPISIDNSTSGGNHVGGRHPSLAVTPSDTVWVVWHDHRNCTSAGSWIDNIEIYGDYKPSGGSFTAADVRLTTSNAAHSGDNGYTPKIAVRSTGRISVAWYDFYADANVSDIYLKTSDASGVFNLGETMSSMQITSASSRGGTPAYTVPDLAIDASGNRHLVWAGGTGAGVNLYYATAAEGATSVTEQILASAGTNFYDPPHVTVAPNGDIWIAYADNSTGGLEQVVLLRKPAGQGSFNSPIYVTSGAVRHYSEDLAVDVSGRAHLVWIDERSGRHVYYGVYDPSLPGLTTEYPLTPVSGSWIRPTLMLDSAGDVYVLFEQNTSLVAGDIWFTTTAQINAVDSAMWNGYE